MRNLLSQYCDEMLVFLAVVTKGVVQTKQCTSTNHCTEKSIFIKNLYFYLAAKIATKLKDTE